MCFQYTTELRHNGVYVFSIFNGDATTPNLGNYRTDMTISSTALNQSKLLMQKYIDYAEADLSE